LPTLYTHRYHRPAWPRDPVRCALSAQAL